MTHKLNRDNDRFNIFLKDCTLYINIYILFISDKIDKLDIDLEEKTVYVTSSMSGEELLEVIKKTGKTSSYVGIKN